MPAYHVSRKAGALLVRSIVIGPDIYTALDIAKAADKQSAQPGEVFASYCITLKHTSTAEERPRP